MTHAGRKTPMAFFSIILTLTMSLAGAAQAAQIYAVDLSADGKSYAILRELGDQRAIAIYDADDASKPPVGVGLGDLPTMAFAWGGDQHVLVKVSAERAGMRTSDGLKTLKTSRWMAIDKDTGKMETLFGDEQGNDYNYYIGEAGDLVSTLPGNSGHALFSRSTIKIKPTGPTRLQSGDDIIVNALQEVDLRNRKTKRVEEGNEATIKWIADQNGLPIARIDKTPSGGVAIAARANAQGFFRPVGKVDYDDSPYSQIDFYGAADRDGAIQALVTEDGGAQKLLEYDLATGALGDEIFAPASGKIDDVLFDHRRGRASAVISGGEVRHLSADDQKLSEQLSGALSGAGVILISKSANGERMLIKAFPAGGPEEYYFYDATGRRLELIARGD